MRPLSWAQLWLSELVEEHAPSYNEPGDPKASPSKRAGLHGDADAEAGAEARPSAAEPPAGDRERQFRLLLREAQRMETIGLLASGLAHDINNALSIVMGQANILQSVRDEEERALRLERIISTCQRAGDLAWQIVRAARDRAADRKVTLLSPLLKEIAKMVQDWAPEGALLECCIEAPSAAALLAASEFHQILTNLCVNAVEASPHDVIRVHLRHADGFLELLAGWRRAVMLEPQRPPEQAGREEAPPYGPSHGLEDAPKPEPEPLAEAETGSDTEDAARPSCDAPWILLAVENQGPPIPAEQLSRLCDPFFTTKDGGNGLGLAIVRDVVQDLQGGMAIDSGPDRGARFSVLLPRREALPSRCGAPAAHDLCQETPLPRRVAVVDDDQQVAMAVVEMLRTHRVQAQAFADGQSFLAALRAGHPEFDMALVDVAMPRMSGLKVAAAAHEIRPKTRVLLMSAYTEGPGVEAALQLGHACCYLEKPFTETQLIHRLR